LALRAPVNANAPNGFENPSDEAVLTITFGVLGLIGAVTKIYFSYRADMEHHEANGPWAQR
jgi:hypothetical protein